MLELINVTKVFHRGDINEKVAIRNLSLHLAAGEVVTVIGSNGAGKTTLLNTVAGVFPIDEGQILIEGRDITRHPEHIRAAYIGRVFQDPNLGTAASMTIEENLAMALRRGQPLRLRRGTGRRRRELFREHLKLLGLGLENRLATKVGLLSGGQRQALTVLMATIASPKLLLLDEHTAALDPKTAAVVLDLTTQIIERERLSTLMVTHNMEQALTVGTRTIMMHEGRIILDISGPERERVKVPDLLQMFEAASGKKLNTDRLLLAQ
ncbi:MAG: ATP-binding cassette domain-containing protein [Thermoanaerobacterales bacterium]|nr:ATP-binding cassette domain-containing protein [Bacillota bacterium]MDI6906542.1 ATP-binding cassette domain-containing protein [Thermoanaerobacterales bacterium]